MADNAVMRAPTQKERENDKKAQRRKKTIETLKRTGKAAVEGFLPGTAVASGVKAARAAKRLMGRKKARVAGRR